MLRVEQLSLGPMGTNCYVVRPDAGSGEAAVVDPSGDATELRLTLARLGTRCAGILVTHGHWDHLLGVADLAEGTGAKVHMAEGERMLLESPPPITPPGITLRPYAPDVLLSGGETVSVAGIDFDVLAVPGHSPAHLAYHADGCLFSGDVLFAGSVGRTDFPGSDWDTLVSSIRMLVDALPAETVVYPGHGPITTLGDELAGNPFLSELRAERTA
jgi:glyoxylase-like metal-dependent hydrolase (beta-lactamase superfamily II)